MAGTAEIRELILAAAEGVTSGLVGLRAAGIPAALGGFSVEIDYDGGTPGEPAVGAAVRLSIVADQDAGPGSPAPAPVTGDTGWS